MSRLRIGALLVLCGCASAHTASRAADAGELPAVDASEIGGAGTPAITTTRSHYPAGTVFTIDVSGNIVAYSLDAATRAHPVQNGSEQNVCTHVAFDAKSRLYALCYRGGAWNTPARIEVFADGSLAPSPPIRVIEGVHTRLDQDAFDLAVSSDGTIYVVRDVVSNSSCGGSVLVFAPESDGDVAPLREITGDATELSCSAAIAATADKQIYVGNAEGGPVLVFDAEAGGNAAPIRRVGGDFRAIGDATGVALDAAGRLYVADWSNNDIVMYAPGAIEGATAERIITGVGHPSAVAVDSSGRVFVTADDEPPALSLWVFSSDASGQAEPEIVIPKAWGGGIAISP